MLFRVRPRRPIYSYPYDVLVQYMLCKRGYSLKEQEDTRKAVKACCTLHTIVLVKRLGCEKRYVHTWLILYSRITKGTGSLQPRTLTPFSCGNCHLIYLSTISIINFDNRLGSSLDSGIMK